MFQSADSAPSSTVLGAPVIGAIVHQSSPLSPTNWHKISPILSSPHKERTITAISISFHPPFLLSSTIAEQSMKWGLSELSLFCFVQWVDIWWQQISIKGNIWTFLDEQLIHLPGEISYLSIKYKASSRLGSLSIKSNILPGKKKSTNTSKAYHIHISSRDVHAVHNFPLHLWFS